MKTLKISITIIFAFFLLNSCKKSNAVLAPALVGKWKDIGVKGTVVASFNGKNETTPLDEAATGEITEFKTDGTIVVTGTTDIAKYTNTDKQISITTKDSDTKKDYTFTFNYEISGKILKLTMDKALFISNFSNAAAAGADLGIADLSSIKDIITSVNYTQTFEKQ